MSHQLLHIQDICRHYLKRKYESITISIHQGIHKIINGLNWVEKNPTVLS